MANFKAGDLALIVRGPNVGNQVELIAFLKPGDSTPLKPGYFPDNEMTSSASGDGCLVIFRNEDIALEPPHYLMPLLGDEQPAQQRKQEQPA